MPRPELGAIRSLVWLYSSGPQRLALATLTAIEREIGASLRPELDHQVAHTRLDWWREECERTAHGRPSHPLTRELTALFAATGAAPLGGLAGLVEDAAWDLSRATFDRRQELTAYCARWSDALISPLMRLGMPAATSTTAQAFGVSLREIELLLALPADARAGRVRVPLDELGHARVPVETLARPPWPAALAELLRERHRALRATLSDAVATLEPAARKLLRGLVVWAMLACAASARAQARLPRASSPRDQQAPLDGWRAWRAARRVDRHATNTSQT